MAPCPRCEDSNSYQGQLLELRGELTELLDFCREAQMSRKELRSIFQPLLSRQSEVGSEEQAEAPAPAGSRRPSRAVLLAAGVLVLALLVASVSLPIRATLAELLHAHVRLALIGMLPHWDWTSLYYSKCVLRNPFFDDDVLTEDDCSVCESLESLERVRNVSQLVEAFLAQETPFVVSDAMDDWGVMSSDDLWFDNVTLPYLREDRLRTIRPCTLASNVRLPPRDLQAFLRSLGPHRRHWFVHWENCHKEAAKVVRRFYQRPYFLSRYFDLTGSNWVLMASDFRGRVYKEITPTDNLMLVAQLRGFNHVRLVPKDPCRGLCPELTDILTEGEMLVFTKFLWNFEYIPGEDSDNLAFAMEVRWPAFG